MSDRKGRVISGALAALACSFILQLANLLVVPLYLQHTSQDYYGLWLTMLSILAWIKLGELGMFMSLSRDLIVNLNKGNRHLVSRRITCAIFIVFLSSTTIAVGLWNFRAELLDALSLTGDIRIEAESSLLILAFLGVARPIAGMLMPLVNALQRLVALHVINTSSSLVSLILTLHFLQSGVGFKAFAYGLSAECGFLIMFSYLYIKKIEPQIRLLSFSIDLRETLVLLLNGGKFQLLKMANLVATNTDNIVIAAILGTSSVAVYTFTGKLPALFAVFIISIIPSILFPGLTELYEQNENAKLRKIYLRLIALNLRISTFAAVFLYLGNQLFVHTWVGEENYGGELLASLYIVWLISESYLRGIFVFSFASGKLNTAVLVSILEAVFNIILTFVFLSLVGLYGALIASILARVPSMFLITRQINNTLGIDPLCYLKYLVSGVIRYSVIPLGMLFCLHVIGLIDKTSAVNVVLNISVILLVSLVWVEGGFLYQLKGLTFKQRIKELRDKWVHI